jgi:hypothetical protein
MRKSEEIYLWLVLKSHAEFKLAFTDLDSEIVEEEVKRWIQSSKITWHRGNC